MIVSGKKQNAMLEAYKRENRCYTVYDQYRRNYKLRPLTAKFYARHEGEEALSAEYHVSNEELYLHIAAGPKEKQEWPATMNQEYGWFSEPFVKKDPTDRRLGHPRLGHDFIKHILKLSKDSTMKQDKFTGVPFLLQ